MVTENYSGATFSEVSIFDLGNKNLVLALLGDWEGE